MANTEPKNIIAMNIFIEGLLNDTTNVALIKSFSVNLVLMNMYNF